ncbi:hypothetical protein CAEBREN_01674 [Caenorhabditis brenneri]|uniref:Uncharacterized protein n=1 Tax=Caenorhabditis brenneri TaxID=135651 RepID=G0MDG8_CAEBE|nr:hypothetical protein CAEBREN_01674 [Caenorhabditis brenneri]
MNRKLKYVGDHGSEERGTRYGYDTQPSSKQLIVPTEGCLEITLTPNARFRYELQFVNIILTSGILTLENPARGEHEFTQLFGFFGKNDVLKFGIRLRNEKEAANVVPLYPGVTKREEGNSAGELHIVHGGVINEEDTWEMLSNYYEKEFISARTDWSLRPGFHNFEVYIGNEKDEKVKKLEVIYNEICDAWKKRFEVSFRNIGKKENKPEVLDANSSKKEMKEDEKEKSKKVFEKKDWRAENHGLKVVKLTKCVDEKPESKGNEPEKSVKPTKSISQKSEKSDKSNKQVSQKSVPKEVVAETLVSENAVPKSNQLKYIGEQGYEERGCLYAYDTHPSSKLIVPTKGCLEITLTPNARFRYDIQFVNITLNSGIFTLENPARSDFDRTQCFGFFGKNDVLKFGIRLRNEVFLNIHNQPSLLLLQKEMANVEPLYFQLNKREEGRSAGELHIVHGGVINKEDTWEMLSNYYEEIFISPRADWSLHPGFHKYEVHIENEKDKKVKKLEAIYNEKCEARKKDLNESKSNEKSEVLDNTLKLEKKKEKKGTLKKVFERKDWRAENHGLKVGNVTKPASEELKKDGNKPEKSAKSEKSISKISKKSEKSKKSESHKSVPKELVVETLVSQIPPPKSNRSERARTPVKSQKSASSVKSSSKETGTKTEITQTTGLKSSAESEKVQTQEVKKKKNPCCKLKYIGKHGYEERGELYGYDILPSSKLMVPTEGCLEVTLTPNKRFRYRLQFVIIIVTSGVMKIENSARDDGMSSQLFGFFGKNDVLKFGIRMKTEEEVGEYTWSEYHEREEGISAGELYIAHGGVINEEDSWEMLSNYYKGRYMEGRVDWSLHPGFDRLEVYIENEKDEKKKENKPEGLEANSLKKEMKEDEKEKSKKIFEKKDWRAENHGLKVVKLTKPASEEPKKDGSEPEKSAKSEKSLSKKFFFQRRNRLQRNQRKKDGNKPEKSAKSEKSISKISKKSEKSKKSESHKSVPKEVAVESLASKNPPPKSNRSERAHSPGKSQKSASFMKSSSKETGTKTEITQNKELKSSAEPEKVPNQEKKKKKNPCCSIL